MRRYFGWFSVVFCGARQEAKCEGEFMERDLCDEM
jgi:hypothetical protein